LTRFAARRGIPLRHGAAEPSHVPAKEDLVAQKFTFDDLKNILVNRIGLPDKLVVDDPKTTFESMGLDSLAFVDLQLAVQQQYGFSIPDEDAHKIHTVGEAIDYTNRRIQKG
jgi:acyl carrier protein